MRHPRQLGTFERFLWGEVLLVSLLAVSLALFLADGRLRTVYELPRLQLVLTTLFALAGGLVALLTATRFMVEGRRFDLLLCAGFLTMSASWLAFTIAPAVARPDAGQSQIWAGLASGLLGWSFLAAAPFVHGQAVHRRAAFTNLLLAMTFVLLGAWEGARLPGVRLPVLDESPHGQTPVLLTAAVAGYTLLNLVAVIGFANRYRVRDQDLDRWLALGATLMLFASLEFVFRPVISARYVSQGDFLRLLGYGVLLVGVWRAIQASEYGRAVAEERARVAREIHDGLAQYLFAVATHASLLEEGADPRTIVPRLKEAADAAQREARFAVLALSSAAGSAPFDSALRRYVDFLTADGVLEVELEIDPGVRLAPDEQIEVFRIVQEGLGNVRLHAGARHAWVSITKRGNERLVAVTDDGSGFASVGVGDGAGQGLRNMRQRAALIGGAFSLQSAPGRGTALEVVLRS